MEFLKKVTEKIFILENGKLQLYHIDGVKLKI